MAFLSDNVLDNGLEYVKDNGANLYITSNLATTYTEATSTYTLGNKDGIEIGSPGDASPNGRKVTISAITDGDVTADGTAAYWAITDGSSELIAAQSLSSSQGVTMGNVFTLTSFAISMPDPA
jgi:hypothetical protein